MENFLIFFKKNEKKLIKICRRNRKSIQKDHTKCINTYGRMNCPAEVVHSTVPCAEYSPASCPWWWRAWTISNRPLESGPNIFSPPPEEENVWRRTSVFHSKDRQRKLKRTLSRGIMSSSRWSSSSWMMLSKRVSVSGKSRNPLTITGADLELRNGAWAMTVMKTFGVNAVVVPGIKA